MNLSVNGVANKSDAISIWSNFDLTNESADKSFSVLIEYIIKIWLAINSN